MTTIMFNIQVCTQVKLYETHFRFLFHFRLIFYAHQVHKKHSKRLTIKAVFIFDKEFKS